MSEIMPTTGEVRERFIDGFPIDTWAVSRDECGQDFDRWKAEVERAAAVRAIEEAASSFEETTHAWGKLAMIEHLRARAAEIRGDHVHD